MDFPPRTNFQANHADIERRWKALQDFTKDLVGEGAGNRPSIDTIVTQSLQRERINAGQSSNSLTSMPIHDVAASNYRPPNMPQELYTPEGYGNIPTNEVAVNGAFRNRPPTQPQKFVFLTYDKDSNHFYDCKIPMKINIPGGDDGLYKATVNEVLFRNDANILNPGDTLSFVNLQLLSTGSFHVGRALDDGNEQKDTVFGVIENGDNADERRNVLLTDIYKYYDGMNMADPNLPGFDQINIPLLSGGNTEGISYLTNSSFSKLLTALLPTRDEGGSIRVYHQQVYLRNLTDLNDHKIYRATFSYDYDYAQNIEIGTNVYSGVGLQIALPYNQTVRNNGLIQGADAHDFIIEADNTITIPPIPADAHWTNVANSRQELTITTVYTELTGTGGIRNIIPQLTSTNTIAAKSYPNKIAKEIQALTRNIYGFDIPWMNYAGPSVYLLNTSAKSLCPIGNDVGSQYNANALSYNTALECLQLVQMQSNIPLIIKNGMDFRVWLTDYNGNFVKIKSPMYLQVTVEPFNNAEFYST